MSNDVAGSPQHGAVEVAGQVADQAAGHDHVAESVAEYHPTTYQIPPGVFVELDQRGWQFTNIVGAMALTGMSRRTIQDWIARGRVEVRRTPSNRPQIKVASLWKTEGA